MLTEVLVATTNPAKAHRLRMVCDGLVSFREMPNEAPVIEEEAVSHLGNAIAKAVGWTRTLGGVAIASDGGLVIPALGAGWESTLTKRQTGVDASDEERARRLLRRMSELVASRREAFWTEAIAIAREGALVGAWEADGTAGRIGLAYEPDPNGPAGFWADGLWEDLRGRKRWQLSEADRQGILDPWATLTSPVRDVLTRMG
jgi:inosine/xanthosine triphosphate pyrophosphatase family protein